MNPTSTETQTALQPTCEDIALATLIVACLSYEGYVPLNLQNSDSRQDYMNSIRLTAALLASQRAPSGEIPALPFQW